MLVHPTSPHDGDTVVGGVTGGHSSGLDAPSRAWSATPGVQTSEATSALDSVSERKIQAALAAVVSGRTTIAVAHRLSTIQSADVIHVVERGRIVESGTHERLLTTGTVYRALYDEQFGAGDVECECADGVVWADGRFGPSDGADDVAARARSIRTRHRRQPVPADAAGER